MTNLDKEWEKWLGYVRKRYDIIEQQMSFYEEENTLFTRQMAAEMGMELTPEEVRNYSDLIKYTFEIVKNERNENN